MESPSGSGPAVAMRRSEFYRPGASPVKSPPRAPAEPSTNILQSLLYNFAHTSYLNPAAAQHPDRPALETSQRQHSAAAIKSESPTDRARTHHLDSTKRHRDDMPTSPSMYRQVSPVASPGYDAPYPPRYFPTPSATVTSPRSNRVPEPAVPAPTYPETYLSPRHRSSSIGSAGSSVRDSRSPSHDSTGSRDSLSRCSPLSSASSPSPSPPSTDPATTGSKLFGILKGGAYNYQYGIKNTRTPSAAINSRRSSNLSEKSNTSSNRYKRISEMCPNSPLSDIKLPKSYKRDIAECQDEPMDLSCKSKIQRTDSPDSVSRSLSWGSDYYSTSSLPERQDTPDNIETPQKSILHSILCGGRSGGSTGRGSRYSTDSAISNKPFRTVCSPEPPSPSYARYGMPSPFKTEPVSPPTSPITPAGSPLSSDHPRLSLPPSPSLSVASPYGLTSPKPRCPWRQQVTLAKKNLFPVTARVSDWHGKILDFAKSLPEFASLPVTDKVVLVQQCWTRLMLLYMAENNFHFAVTPVHEDADDGRPPAITGIDPSEPTMDSVELVQNFIRKCQGLGLENKEYRCLRIVTLFHPGCTGLDNVDYVDKISSSARQTLQTHVRRTRPDDRLRYSNLLLCLHTLSGVNCGMVQTLFCKHLFKDKDVDEEMRRLVLRHDPENGDSDSSDGD